MSRLAVEDILEMVTQGVPLFDVRTPSEFAHARIPGARNLPLFDDAERAVVGTTYKQDGRHQAIKVGLDLIGPRMRQLVEHVEAVVGPPDAEQPVIVHCWRGGMRSQSVAWLLGLYGYPVVTLDGGYKSFRRWVLARLEQVPPLLVLGGRTGSGKTQVLAELTDRGEPTIDLEGLANHRGSAFGSLEMPEQPAQEQFEALLALEFRRLEGTAGPIWVEDESRMIGYRVVPDTMMAAMRAARVVAFEVPTEERVAHLVEIYGDADRVGLAESFNKIRKRLGSERTTQALAALAEGDLAGAARIALAYYDKAYDYGLSRRDPDRVHWLPVATINDAAPAVLALAAELNAREERGTDAGI